MRLNFQSQAPISHRIRRLRVIHEGLCIEGFIFLKNTHTPLSHEVSAGMCVFVRNVHVSREERFNPFQTGHMTQLNIQLKNKVSLE